MSLPKDDTEDIFGAQNVLSDFLPENHPMLLFSKEIYPIFSNEDFENCYSNVGRNAKPPSFLALVTILQWKESMSDPEAAEACINRLDWKIALHLPVKQKKSFDSSTLCYFRKRLKRLKKNDKMSLIFDKILELAKEKGLTVDEKSFEKEVKEYTEIEEEEIRSEPSNYLSMGFLVELGNHTININQIEYIECMDYNLTKAIGDYTIFFISGKKLIIEDIDDCDFNKLNK